MPPKNVLPSPEEKRGYVREMFTAIAPRYDLMNRLMTLGRDRAWRRAVVRLCRLPRGGRLLDMATGTGDVAYEALRGDPTLRATGMDLTREMMVRGIGKQPGAQPAFVQGDALAIPSPDCVFDAACSAFMMRNVVDVAGAFREQARVVKPGGRVVCLEITRPGLPVFSNLFAFYFFRIVPAVGGLLSGNRRAYTYLPQSTVGFPRPPELARIMQSAGLVDVRYHTAMVGTVAIHWGTRA